ncbi:MAG: Hpt domain-containing protein, partial [Desulfobulbaceae bacterium]|nr:Hpt domain-containing protein [Desulfobulbaceae bacterium]
MIDSSMLPDFIIEAQEHLEELEGSLLHLEQEQDRDVLDDIFRAMHTIKGAAQFVGIDRVAELSHKLENLLDLIRREEQPLNEEIIELLIAGKDRISLLVDELQENQVEKSEVKDLLSHINAIVVGEADDSIASISSISSDESGSLASVLEEENLATISDELDNSINSINSDNSDNSDNSGVRESSFLAEDTVEEEYDEELYGIFMQQLKENMPFLRSQTVELTSSGTVEKQDVLNRCSDAIRSLKSSANYMGYENLTNHYNAWLDSIAVALDRLTRDRDTDLSFMHGFIEEICATYPHVMEGEFAEEDPEPVETVAEEAGGDDMVTAIHALFDEPDDSSALSDVDPAQQTVAGGDLNIALESVFDEEDEGPAFSSADEDSPVAAASPIAAASPDPVSPSEDNGRLEDESVGEVHDQELVEIFRQQLKTKIPLLEQQVSELASSSDKGELLKQCAVTLKSIRSASNYMGYTRLTSHYSTWQDELEGAILNLTAGGQPDLTFMQTSLDEVVRVYSPETFEGSDASLHTESEEVAVPVAETANAGSPVSTDDDEFEDLAETIGSLLSDPPPAVIAENRQDTARAAFEEEPVAAEPATGSAGDDLFDQLSNALEASLDQDLNVSEMPMHTVIEKMIEPVTGEEDNPAQEDALTAPVSAPSVVTAEAAENTRVAVEETIAEPAEPVEQKETAFSFEADSLDSRKSEEELQAELREVKRQEAEKKPVEKKIKQSMRVDADKIDYLMNQVGELVVSRAYFAQLFNEMKGLQQSLQENFGLTKSELKPINEFAFRLGEAGGHLGRVSNELQEGVMKVRMLPIAQLFKRFPRLVRDLIHKTDKLVNLETRGEETELDKMVIEEISDPLIHIIRNSVDHGIETKAERRKLGKPETATLTLESFHESDHIVVEVTDDGRGIDVEKVKARALAMRLFSKDELMRMSQTELTHIIMHPGFSTADKTTETSGRGVGMD